MTKHTTYARPSRTQDERVLYSPTSCHPLSMFLCPWSESVVCIFAWHICIDAYTFTNKFMIRCVPIPVSLGSLDREGMVLITAFIKSIKPHYTWTSDEKPVRPFAYITIRSSFGWTAIWRHCSLWSISNNIFHCEKVRSNGHDNLALFFWGG